MQISPVFGALGVPQGILPEGNSSSCTPASRVSTTGTAPSANAPSSLPLPKLNKVTCSFLLWSSQRTHRASLTFNPMAQSNGAQGRCCFFHRLNMSERWQSLCPGWGQRGAPSLPPALGFVLRHWSTFQQHFFAFPCFLPTTSSWLFLLVWIQDSFPSRPGYGPVFSHQILPPSICPQPPCLRRGRSDNTLLTWSHSPLI